MEPSSCFPDFVTDMNAVLKHNSATWLIGTAPDYSGVNRLYYEERTHVPEAGSLAEMITNIVKNWEKELAHKTDPKDWVTFSAEKFKMSVNGKPFQNIPELAAAGAYNVFIGDTEFYAASLVNDPNESNRIFRSALCTGFAWEVLDVYSRPPNVAFKWRHWGKMGGDLKCPMRNGKELNVKGVGQRVEIFGISTMKLNDKFQILEIEHFFRPDELMEQMVAGTGDEMHRA